MQKRNCFLVKIKLHIEKIKNNSTIIDYQKTYAFKEKSKTFSGIFSIFISLEKNVVIRIGR